MRCLRWWRISRLRKQSEPLSVHYRNPWIYNTHLVPIIWRSSLPNGLLYVGTLLPSYVFIQITAFSCLLGKSSVCLSPLNAWRHWVVTIGCRWRLDGRKKAFYLVSQEPHSLYVLMLFFHMHAGKMLVPLGMRDLVKVSRPELEADTVVLASRRLLGIWGGHVNRLVGNLPLTQCCKGSKGLQSIRLLCSIDIDIGQIAHAKVKQNVVFEI